MKATAQMEDWEILNYERKRRAFLDAIQPIIKTKMGIYALMLPRMIVHQNGEVEHDYQFSVEQQKALSSLDELIDACGRSCYGSEWDQAKAKP